MPRARGSRQPLHAGSWYDAKGTTLAAQIEAWLQQAADGAGDQADPTGVKAPRAIIAPHAGYRYCGRVMGAAYRHIDPSSIKRVFLLGPSHHVYTRKCMLSGAAQYDTPLGPLVLDQEVYAELQRSNQFDNMSLDVDEAEHSLELHTPFIHHVLRGSSATLVPVMVGALSTEGEARYGRLLAPYLDDPSNLFIISSDFCHWGSRFSYTYYDAAHGPIWKSIQWLDEQGMRIIEKGDPAAFTSYLQAYRNTICGRHPIAVLLNMLQHCHTRFHISFNCYDQSSKCSVTTDSSVSYASALVVQAAGEARTDPE